MILTEEMIYSKYPFSPKQVKTIFSRIDDTCDHLKIDMSYDVRWSIVNASAYLALLKLTDIELEINRFINLIDFNNKREETVKCT